MYYLEVLRKELTTTNTYIESKSNKTQIRTEHAKTLKDFNIPLTNPSLPTIYWLPKLHKSPYKSRFIANSSHCSLKDLSIHISSALTAVKSHLINYCKTAYINSGVNYFWSINNSTEVLEKINSCNNVTSISSYDFSTLYTSLPHDQIKKDLKKLIKWCFDREKSQFIATRYDKSFFTDKPYDTNYKSWTCNELCMAITFLIDNIFVEFDNRIYRQVIGIPMGTNCAPLIADLFLFCQERNFMDRLVKNKKLDLIESFNRTSRYLDDILNINNPKFEKYIPDIYPKELLLTKANLIDNHVSFLDLDLKINASGTIESKIYDKRDDFGFPIVNFPWLDGDVPRAPCYGIYISQLVRFARACSNVNDFHSRNLLLSSKLISQGYRYHKLRKTFGKFYKNYKELLLKFGAISFYDYVTHGIAQPKFYGDLVLKLRKVANNANFQTSCRKIIKKFLYRKYDKYVIRQTLLMVEGTYTTFNLSSLFPCTLTGNALGNQ